MAKKYYEYKTIEGDTFDSIALDFYNEEKYASLIIQSNNEYRTVIIFDSGKILKIPVIEESSVESLPPWKR